MASRTSYEPDRMSSTVQLGAVELTSFDTVAANDNKGVAQEGYRAKQPLLPPSLIAFAGGLAVALLVAGVGQWLGITV